MWNLQCNVWWSKVIIIKVFVLFCSVVRCLKCKCILFFFRCFRQEQLSLCVRYTNGLNVVERFLGFIDVSMKQDANALASAMTNFFVKNGISQSIVAQSYDGGMGHLWCQASLMVFNKKLKLSIQKQFTFTAWHTK